MVIADIENPSKESNLLYDYGDALTDLQSGGRLKPNINVDMEGESPPVHFITNAQGFRNSREYAAHSSSDTFRILYIGDSFVGGYRVDQEKMSGKILQNTLNAALQGMPSTIKQVEVLVVVLADPAEVWYWLYEYDSVMNPDLIVLGIALGNDLAGTHLSIGPHGLYRTQEDDSLRLVLNKTRDWESLHNLNATQLPKSVNILNLGLVWRGLKQESRLLNLLAQSYLVQRMSSIQPRSVIASAHGDHLWGTRIHAFDFFHALGFFHISTLDVVDEAFEQTFQALNAIHTYCEMRTIPLLFVLFPQRFQVTEEEWDRTVDLYSLNPDHFDIEYPNRRIMERCGTEGMVCIDLLPAFRTAAKQEPGDLYLPAGDMHWNSRGHHVAGETIAHYILKQFL